MKRDSQKCRKEAVTHWTPLQSHGQIICHTCEDHSPKLGPTEPLCQVPTQEGLYWASEPGKDWYNLIVEVYGTSPFFRIRGWDRKNDLLRKLYSHDIKHWGPKIEEPKLNIISGKSLAQ